MTVSDISENDMATDRARSLKTCLDYLYRQAISENFLMTAHLIGAAAESLAAHVEETELPQRIESPPPRAERI